MDPNELLSVAANGLGGILGSMYLDARFAISRDLSAFRHLVGTILTFKRAQRQGHLHIYYRFKEKAKTIPDKTFLVFEGTSYTFRQIEKASNRLAHWLLSQNVKPKDVICMMLQNHPTFFIALFAISKVGAVPSLINTNLSEGALLHCLKIANTRIFLFDPAYEAQVATVFADDQNIGISLYAYGELTEKDQQKSALEGVTTLTESFLNTMNDEDIDERYMKTVQPTDPAMLIYTSGTTGMPKAAIVDHQKANVIMWTCASGSGLRQDDRVYCVLPLYHSTGLLVSAGSALVTGCTLVIGRKFSASRFWDHCVENNITVFHYIGELCRYLVNRPPHPLERKHSVRMIFGNGMRPDVWKRVRERFGITDILEFYGATEGIGGFFNYNRNDRGLGAVGQHGLLMRLLNRRAKLIKVDPVTETPWRGKNGFCAEVGYDEPGELVMRIDPEGMIRFTGYYKNDEATNKKILCNVFKKGDMYFRTGDLFKTDRSGYYYFCDRLGDTFRWRSENVATTEVAHAVSEYPGIAEANVYGTLVPNHDGRAGMAAIVPQPDAKLDMKDFYRHLAKRLPRYAIPLFLRFLPSMTSTGTFKQQKFQLRNEGIDLEKVPADQQPLYWLRGDTYVPFRPEDYEQIKKGDVKL